MKLNRLIKKMWKELIKLTIAVMHRSMAGNITFGIQ